MMINQSSSVVLLGGKQGLFRCIKAIDRNNDEATKYVTKNYPIEPFACPSIYIIFVKEVQMIQQI